MSQRQAGTTTIPARYKRSDRRGGGIALAPAISTRAEKVTTELGTAFKRVGGKENILFQVAEASLAAPTTRSAR